MSALVKSGWPHPPTTSRLIRAHRGRGCTPLPRGPTPATPCPLARPGPAHRVRAPSLMVACQRMSWRLDGGRWVAVAEMSTGQARLWVVQCSVAARVWDDGNATVNHDAPTSDLQPPPPTSYPPPSTFHLPPSTPVPHSSLFSPSLLIMPYTAASARARAPGTQSGRRVRGRRDANSREVGRATRCQQPPPHTAHAHRPPVLLTCDGVKGCVL